MWWGFVGVFVRWLVGAAVAVIVLLFRDLDNSVDSKVGSGEANADWEVGRWCLVRGQFGGGGFLVMMMILLILSMLLLEFPGQMRLTGVIIDLEY